MLREMGDDIRFQQSWFATLCRSDGAGWIRLGRGGAGFDWEDTRKHGLRFSERNGYRRALTIGWLRVGFLPAFGTRKAASKEGKAA